MLAIEQTIMSEFDFSVVCHAEVDMPEWLSQLTGQSGWKLCGEDEAELSYVYSFRCGREEAQVVLFNTGYATVDVGDRTLYDGSLLTIPGCIRRQYYNSTSGAPVLLN